METARFFILSLRLSTLWINAEGAFVRSLSDRIFNPDHLFACISFAVSAG
jgi:hypothetical protein